MHFTHFGLKLFVCNANDCVLFICQVKKILLSLTFGQIFPESILLPPVNGVDASEATSCHLI